jgi:DNA-binding IclR family transcriptional regulator
MAAQLLQTVSRAAAMLRAFEGGTTQLTLTELAETLGFGKVNTLRLARTLVHEGLLVHEPRSRRYALSVGCLALCRGLLDRNGLVETAHTYLERARDATGETACLMVREGWHRVVIDMVPSKLPVRYVLDIGDRRAVYLGAAGQCLLTGLDEEDWRQLAAHLQEEKKAGRVQITMEVIQERLQLLRERGWAMGRGEWAAEAAGAAAPIRDAKGKVVAAITMAAPLTRASDAHMEMCGRMALAAAESISDDLRKFGV